MIKRNPEWIEGDLYFDFSKAKLAINFDNSGRGNKLTHLEGFKSIDFILEDEDLYLFLEIKDLDNHNIPGEYKEKNISQFLSQDLTTMLLKKFDDSLFYQSMEEGIPNKKFLYVVLFCLTHPSFDRLVHFTTLRDSIFMKKPSLKGGRTGWKKGFDIIFLNIEQWNSAFPQYPVLRLSVINE